MNAPYTFVYLKQKKDYFKKFDNDFIKFLEKWGMRKFLMVQKYGFNQEFNIYDSQRFCECFFTDQNVYNSLKIIQNEQWTVLGENFSKVSTKVIPCSSLSMSFFDKLFQEDNDIIKASKYINKCFDEEIDGILVQDKLRQMLINQESEEYELFNETERDEFIFRLFKHLVLGGRLCQYEDDINNYMNFTKLFYKDLISVLKEPQTNNIKITSHVIEVKVEDYNNKYIFPQDPDHHQNFAYLIIDPIQRELKVLSHYAGTIYFN